MEESKGTVALRWINRAVTVILVLAVVLCLYVVIQLLTNGHVNIGGFMMFRVVTGSMEPTMSIGALLVARQVDIESIQLQDIVCFYTEEAAIYGSVVTHRVVDIINESGGTLLLETKGDANLVADGFLVGQDQFIGKVVWYTGDDSFMATVFAFLTNKIGFLGCIVFPCLILGGLLLRSCVNNIREELRQAQEELDRKEAEEEVLVEMDEQQYEEMAARIREELKRELMQNVAIEGEHDVTMVQAPGAEENTTE